MTRTPVETRRGVDRRLIAVIRGLAVASAIVLVFGSIFTLPSVRISHAGGGLPEGRNSNSLEALDRAYARGFRLFEVDLELTTDGHVVLLHDWKQSARHWFGLSGPTTRSEFLGAQMRGGLTQMDLDSLLEWMRHHPDARVVTDAKRENLRVLSLLSVSDRRDNFIPQIYTPDDISAARNMGFRDLIFTNYRAKLSHQQLVNLSPEIFAVTVPWREAFRLEGRIFVHTVNHPLLMNWLILNGVDGVYTDELGP